MKNQYTQTTRKIATACGATFLALVVSVSAHAGWGKSDHHEKIVERISKKIDLTAEQKTSLEDVAKTFMEAMKAQHDMKEDQMEARREEDKAFWNTSHLSADALLNHFSTKSTQRQNEMQETLRPVAIKLAAFHATLTEEQRTEFAELAAKKSLFGGRGGRYGKGGRGGHESKGW